MSKPITIMTIPAISTLRSAESGWGAGCITLFRGVGDLVFTTVLAREVWVVLFLARLGVLVVVLVFFLVPGVFLVLLAVVLRAIAI